MLVEDSIAQDMAKKVATADYAGDKGQNVGEGTAFESDGTDNDGQDGDYQYQESKIGTAVAAHRESIDPDEHDGCEDEIDVVETVHGCLEQGHAVEEDRVGSGDEDEQFEDGHEHGGLDIEESDSDSSSSDSGSDWAPKKKKTVAARKSKKRSREFFETAEERLAGKTTREERSRSRKSKRQRTRRIPAESKRTRSQTLVTTLSGPAKVYTLACLLAISNPIQKMTLLGTIPRPLITAQASSDHQWHRSLERGRSRQRRVNPSAPPRSLTGPSLATLVSAIGVRKDH